MKKIFFLLLFLTTSVYAQGTVSSMPEETTPVGADLLYLVKNPGGAGTSRKVTVTNLTKALNAASTSSQGVVTTGIQSLAGEKTLTSGMIIVPSSTTNIGLTVNLPASHTATAIKVNNSSAANVFSTTDTESGGNIRGRIRIGPNSSGIFESGGTALVLTRADNQKFSLVGNNSLVYANTVYQWANTSDVGGQLSTQTADTGLTRSSAGVVEVNNGTAGTLRDLRARSIILTSSPPAAANSTGVQGTITWDSSFIYVCTATDTWKRVAIATW